MMEEGIKESIVGGRETATRPPLKLLAIYLRNSVPFTILRLYAALQGVPRSEFRAVDPVPWRELI